MMYIAPPFGNYFTYKDAIPVRGTFTAHPRKGLIYHTLRSLRPVRGGWRNQIGFRNRGIDNVMIKPDCVYSICGLNDDEWEQLFYSVPQGTKLELNLSCPNVSEITIPPHLIKAFVRKFPNLLVKVRYDISDYDADHLKQYGIQNIHCSNTIPTYRGGISGSQLRDENMSAIERLSKLSFKSLIAGGGIYSANHVKQYRDMGATDFSISTVYISCPWNIPSIYRSAYD